MAFSFQKVFKQIFSEICQSRGTNKHQIVNSVSTFRGDTLSLLQRVTKAAKSTAFKYLYLNIVRATSTTPKLLMNESTNMPGVQSL